MDSAGGDRRHVVDANDVHGSVRVDEVAGSELAVVVVTERRKGAVRAEDETVFACPCDGGDVREARDSDGSGAITCGAQSKLIVTVSAPGPDLAVADGKAVVVPCPNRGDLVESDRLRRVSVGKGAITDLACRVQTPGVQRARRIHSHHMMSATSDVDDRRQPGVDLV